MEASIENLTKDFTAVAFEEDELEFRDMSELKSFLPNPCSQDSNSIVGILI